MCGPSFHGVSNLRTNRGEPAKGAKDRAATLYSVDPTGPDHEAAIRFKRRGSEAADPFCGRHVGHAIIRVTDTSDRRRRPQSCGRLTGYCDALIAAIRRAVAV